MIGRVVTDSGCRRAARVALATAVLASAAWPVLVAQMPDDSGAISGVVATTIGAHDPVDQVIVTVVGGTLTNPRSTVTDDHGRFTIDHLPAGRFALTATKSSYVTTVYGATRIGQPGIDIVLTAGERITDLLLRLTPGASVSGTVHGSNGQPLPNARITLMRVGATGLVAAAVAGLSDDRGVYRVFGLPAGEYLVEATPQTGLFTVAGSMTSAEVDATLAALGRGRVGGRPSTGTQMASPRTINVVPVFYPGTLSPGEAIPIHVAAGEERTDVNISVVEAKTASISGDVASPFGPLPQIRLTLSVQGPPLPIAMGGTVPDLQPGPDGSFHFQSVNPGRYVLMARGAVGPDGRDSLWARAVVDVSGTDVSGVNLVLAPALRLAGHVTFDGARAPSGAELARIHVGVENTAPDDMPRTTAIGVVTNGALIVGSPLHPDGTFDITGLMPAAYRLVVSGIPPGWSARSAVLGTRDILDVPYEVTGPVQPITVTLTDRPASLNGVIRTSASASASAYSILVFPVDRSLWQPGSRRIQTARAGTDGSYVFEELAPGDYFVAALSDFSPDDLADPSFLDTLVRGAAHVRIDEGERKSQDLQIGRMTTACHAAL